MSSFQFAQKTINSPQDTIGHCSLDLTMANRHGLISGATGTGKTVTLQKFAEEFSKAGVSVFLADIKGDLSGLAALGGTNPKLSERLSFLKIENHDFKKYPVQFWDVFGKNGLPIKIHVSDFGPQLLAQILRLNDTQEGVLQIVFKYADDNNLEVLDFKDLTALIKHIAENSKEIQKLYGLISQSSLGAIQRNLLDLEMNGGHVLFGEPHFNIADFIHVDDFGFGQINLLYAEKLVNSPKLYSLFLLWMISELFENLPEVGDLDRPKLVFFFDEAHLLFKDTPKSLVEKIEQVVRLIRSKGIGIYFVTQSPMDIPTNVLGQLGHRVQHALRAFTPQDKKAVTVVAETMRENPELEIKKVITELAVGEALVSTLEKSGVPSVTQRAWVLPPESKIGPISSEEKTTQIKNFRNDLSKKYSFQIDSNSAFEKLNQLSSLSRENDENKKSRASTSEEALSEKQTQKRQTQRATVGEAMMKSAGRALASELGKGLVRGILGSLMGGGRR